jgi:hypothetical protein
VNGNECVILFADVNIVHTANCHSAIILCNLHLWNTNFLLVMFDVPIHRSTVLLQNKVYTSKN